MAQFEIKEVSNTIIIDGVEMDNNPETIRAFHENNRRSMEAQRKAENERMNRERTGKTCPLDRFAGSPPECKTSCSLYRGNKCAYSRNKPAPDTLGKKCPLLRTCTEQCALYCGGCTI